MTRTTIFKLLRGGNLPLLLAVQAWIATPMYRGAFLTAASAHGLLRALAEQPRSAEEVAALLRPGANVEPLRAWLDLGVRLGELKKTRRGYALRGFFAKGLARVKNDAIAAALEEVTRFHHEVLLGAPALFTEGRRLSLADQDGALIARSTRVIEPFVEEAVDAFIPKSGPQRLLEVGCGTGVYVRHALARNPRVTAVALELQAEVADLARRNFDAWGLGDRVEVVHGDLRALEFQPQFDRITLHNNIYYFPVEERVRVLARVRRFLAPGGQVLITTACRGGNVGLEVLNLWFASADCGGRLPDAEEMLRQLRDAGFESPRALRLIPGDQYYAFRAANGERALASDEPPSAPRVRRRSETTTAPAIASMEAAGE
jgi:SAM-dependent methyltransferase